MFYFMQLKSAIFAASSAVIHVYQNAKLDGAGVLELNAHLSTDYLVNTLKQLMLGNYYKAHYDLLPFIFILFFFASS